MKHFYKICVAALLTLAFGAETLLAQTTPTPVMIRDLHAYDVLPTSQADLPNHPLAGELVTFDAVVVSYPKNSGLASITNEGLPGRIHVFVADVNAIEEGRDGNYLQFVHGGALRGVLQDYLPGDVIRVEGRLTFFNNVSQFNPSDVSLLGNMTTDAQYADLAPLLQPQVVELGDINIPSPVVDGAHRWNAEAYSKYNHQYVKIEGLEVIGRSEAPTGRPWVALTDGTSIIYTTDTSLRFRNDRGSSYGNNLSYNYRRLAEDLDGPYTPPPAGAIVDIAGYIVVNTFNPAGFDETGVQSTLKIAPWDDGIVWLQDGTDTEFRVTEGINNDLVIQGFPALVELNTATTQDTVTSSQQAVVSANIALPEATYTLGEVRIRYTALGFNDDTATEVTEVLTGSGNEYSFTFPQFPDFTRVSYTIEAVATTPDNVETIGRLNGVVFVDNANITVPPSFSQPSGTYQNSVTVALSTPITGATIYYTLDGSAPTTSSAIYAGSPITLTSSATINAFATSTDREPSPVASRTYTVEVDVQDVNTLAGLRDVPQDGTVFRYTGEAVVTFTRNSRNQRYIMDESGGILIDDAPGIITSPYTVGTVITDLLVTVGTFQGSVQIVPQADPGTPSETRDVVPKRILLSDLDLIHESSLVVVADVEFVGASGDFANATNYTITDPSLGEGETRPFRTAFNEADYIGTPIPTGKVNLVGIAQNFNGTMRIVPRSLDDFGVEVSADRGEMVYEFNLNQNFPNPFNPVTTINYTIGETANVNLVVYDVLGRRVATLVNEVQSAGFHQINFDASRLSSGTYIYRLETNGQVAIKKMMLIK
ncbi:MAG: chitobiase/beta-hexosaminidase C-terminal domain-containing protein [Balneolales bacterium]|nr:chitobiase/beta-hexosaminidase C-terminal domain-containing protein [Balneolales bacterium]